MSVFTPASVPPLPWRIEAREYGSEIVASDGSDVLAFDADESPDEAQFWETLVCALNAHDELVRLAGRVARLNPDAAEIGAGMLAQLVSEAKAALEKAGLPA